MSLVTAMSLPVDPACGMSQGPHRPYRGHRGLQLAFVALLEKPHLLGPRRRTTKTGFQSTALPPRGLSGDASPSQQLSECAKEAALPWLQAPVWPVAASESALLAPPCLMLSVEAERAVCPWLSSRTCGADALSSYAAPASPPGLHHPGWSSRPSITHSFLSPSRQLGRAGTYGPGAFTPNNLEDRGVILTLLTWEGRSPEGEGHQPHSTPLVLGRTGA